MPFKIAFAVSVAVLGVPAIAGALPSAEVNAAASVFGSDEDVRMIVRHYLPDGRAKGVVVGLLEPNGSRRILAFGSGGDGTGPLGGQSLFELGSINKTFTGVLLADMVRKGEVRLDDPVAKYLPADVRVPSRNGREITLLDLATHTSGLPRMPTGYVPPDPANPYADFRAEHLYASLSRHALERDIGAEPLYSNLGMGLLGHALARAAKTPDYQTLLSRRILKPLGLKMTAFGRPPALAPWMTKGHSKDGAQVPYWDVAVLAGAGGLYSNADDLLTYLGGYLRPPSLPIEQAMQDSLKPQRQGPGAYRLGLAWAERQRGGRPIVGHSGGTAGYETYVAISPAQKAGVVILANSAGIDNLDDLAFALLNANARREVPVSRDLLDDYPGTYRLGPNFDIAVTLEDGKLFAQPSRQKKVRLFAEAPDRFFLKVTDAQLEFRRDGAGRIVEATLHQNGRSRSGGREE